MDSKKTHSSNMLMLYFSGLFAFIYQCALARETIAVTGGAEFMYSIIFGFSFLFIGFGAILIYIFQRRIFQAEERSLAAASSSANIALASFIILGVLNFVQYRFMSSAGLKSDSGYPGAPLYIIVQLGLCILIFLIFGCFISNQSLASGRSGTIKNYALLYMGSATASVFLFSKAAVTSIILQCLGALIIMIIAYVSVRQAASMLKRVAIVILALLAVGIIFIPIMKFKNSVDVRQIIIDNEKYYYTGASSESPNGRTEIYVSARTDKQGAQTYAATFNSVISAPLANIPLADFPAALMSSVQPDKKNISVLIFCDMFSAMPAAFRNIPVVRHIDVVLYGPQPMSYDIGNDRFNLYNENPRMFLEYKKKTYDLIIVLPPNPISISANTMYTKEFYKLADYRLSSDGVLVTVLANGERTPPDIAAKFNGVIGNTLRKAFAKVEFVPAGKHSLAICSNGRKITGDFDEMDKRVSTLMPDANSFPEGLLLVLVPQDEQQSEARKIIGTSITSDCNGDLSPALILTSWLHHLSRLNMGWFSAVKNTIDFCAFHYEWIIGIILASYLLLRYFITSKMSRKRSFSSFENGFYAAGFSTLLIFIFQSREGTLFRDFDGLAGTIIVGIAFGALIAEKLPPAIRHVLIWLSLALPLACPFAGMLSWNIFNACVYAALFIAGLSAGIGFVDSIRHAANERAYGLIWGAELTGAAAAVFMISFFLLPINGLWICAAILALCRLSPILTGSAADGD